MFSSTRTFSLILDSRIITIPYNFWFIAIFHPFSYRLSHSVNTFFCGQDPTWENSNTTLANMLSKMVPLKSCGFETRVTDNPKFQAPISLYPEPDETEAEVDKVKVKLQRNPAQQPRPSTKKPYPLDRSYGWGLLPIPSNARQIHPTGAV
jgi:hypothetical protein